MKNIELSIISTTFNDSHFMDDIYKSIKSKLEKEEWEWIIVDDGSNLEHRDLLDSFVNSKSNIALYHIENAGPAYARDYGAKQSSASIIQFIDIDDIAIVENIERGIETLKVEKVDIVVGDCIEFFEDDTLDNYKKCGPINIENMVIKNQWVVSNLLTKDIWEKAKGFFTKHRIAPEDYVFWLRCISKDASVSYINLPFIRYRRKTNNSRNKKKRSYNEKLNFYRTIFPIKLEIVNNHISNKIRKPLTAFIKAELAQHEVQSGNLKKGLKLYSESLYYHPHKGKYIELFFKSLPKRIIKLVTGKEI